jgi:hypothetical protein
VSAPRRVALERWEQGDRLGAIGALGRNEALGFVLDRARDQGFALDGPQDFDLVMALWCMAEWPCRQLPRDCWIRWWGVVTTDRPPEPEPLEIWRAQAGRRIGLSWTTDRELAVWFHNRNQRLGLKDARLLRGFAPPKSVLWRGLNGRNESEAIVKPAPRFWKVVQP